MAGLAAVVGCSWCCAAESGMWSVAAGAAGQAPALRDPRLALARPGLLADAAGANAVERRLPDPAHAVAI
jgi:hypothetical protein